MVLRFQYCFMLEISFLGCFEILSNVITIGIVVVVWFSLINDKTTPTKVV